MTVAQAAQALGLSVAMVRRYVQTGRMKGERIGARVWLIPKEEVGRWKGGAERLKPGRKPAAPQEGDA